VEDARVIVGQRQDLPGQAGQVLGGRQVAVVVWIFGRLVLTPDGSAEQFLGEEASDRALGVRGIDSALQIHVILRADSFPSMIAGLLDRALGGGVILTCDGHALADRGLPIGVGCSSSEGASGQQFCRIAG
jgi:hypothetical protein